MAEMTMTPRMARAMRLDAFERRAQMAANQLALDALDASTVWSTWRLAVDDFDSIEDDERDEMARIINAAVDMAFSTKRIRDKFSHIERVGLGTYRLCKRA